MAIPNLDPINYTLVETCFVARHRLFGANSGSSVRFLESIWHSREVTKWSRGHLALIGVTAALAVLGGILGFSSARSSHDLGIALVGAAVLTGGVRTPLLLRRNS